MADPKRPRERPILAFACTEDCENTGGIVFAKTNAQARRSASSQFGDGDWDGWTVRRAQWADEFVTSDVPVSVMIEHGWHFECSGCGSRIDSDYLWETERESAGIVGTQNSAIYCDEICELSDRLEQAKRKRAGARAIRRFRAIVQRRFPDAEFAGKGHVYVTRNRRGVLRIGQVVVAFNFPGQRYGAAQLRHDRDQTWDPRNRKAAYTCCGGDREAFEAYALPTKKALAPAQQKGAA